MDRERVVTTVEELEARYGVPNEASTVKEVDHLTEQYRTLIAASPFAILATGGPEGLDCSPRGDQPGFVRVCNDRQLMLPDRAGNNRIDSLRNIVRDPRVALLFMLPGVGTTLRVNGVASIVVEGDVLDSFIVAGKAPRSVISIDVQSAYFQCARAIVRSDLWNPQKFLDERVLPTPGEMLAALSAGSVGGNAYDEEWPQRAERTLW